MRRPWLLLLVLAGCHRPDAAPHDPRPKPAWPVAAGNMPGYVEVPLTRTKTGMFQLEVEGIGPGRLNMLLDTGADSIVIDRGVAERLGLPLKESPMQGGGLGAASVTMHSTPFPPLRIGARSRRAAWARRSGSMDLSHVNEVGARFGNPRIDGILGASFLRPHGAVIDYPHEKLLLREPVGEGDVKK